MPGHCLVCVRFLHCMRVRLHNGYTRAYAQIIQHTHTHKAVTGRVEAKKLLSRRRQLTIGRGVRGIFFRIGKVTFLDFFPAQNYLFPGRNFYFGRPKQISGVSKSDKQKRKKKRGGLLLIFIPFPCQFTQFSFSSPFSFFFPSLFFPG